MRKPDKILRALPFKQGTDFLPFDAVLFEFEGA